ncbi:hypothetical protein MYX84_12285 [Acidobacteria bacterium AH-259-O06]|nr:hypothetical protein [Acidobacteria bacterium AH-259-O06]
MTKELILTQLSKFIAGENTLEELEDWLISHSQAVLDSGNQEAAGLIDEVDGLLVELEQELITEKQFVDGILAQIRIVETLERSFKSPKKSQVHLYSAADETVLANADFTGLDPEVAVQFAFG